MKFRPLVNQYYINVCGDGVSPFQAVLKRPRDPTQKCLASQAVAQRMRCWGPGLSFLGNLVVLKGLQGIEMLRSICIICSVGGLNQDQLPSRQELLPLYSVFSPLQYNLLFFNFYC